MKVRTPLTHKKIKIINASNEPGSDEGIHFYDFKKKSLILKYWTAIIINYTKMKPMLAGNGQYY